MMVQRTREFLFSRSSYWKNTDRQRITKQDGKCWERTECPQGHHRAEDAQLEEAGRAGKAMTGLSFEG